MVLLIVLVRIKCELTYSLCMTVLGRLSAIYFKYNREAFEAVELWGLICDLRS